MLPREPVSIQPRYEEGYWREVAAARITSVDASEYQWYDKILESSVLEKFRNDGQGNQYVPGRLSSLPRQRLLS